jgi:hypothetical protein
MNGDNNSNDADKNSMNEAKSSMIAAFSSILVRKTKYGLRTNKRLPT